MLRVVDWVSFNFLVLAYCCCKWFNENGERDGESGHPCLVPWCKVKLVEVIPFVTIVALGEVYSIVIHWMKDSSKPNLWRVVNKNVQLTLLNAFSASSDTITVFCCCLCAMVMRLKSLRLLSDACLFLMKPVWSGWISDCITFIILVARVFVIIFKSVLINDSGR